MPVDVSQLNKLAVDLARSSGAVGAKVARVVRKTASDLEAQAKSFAPVDTGALRNSISTEITGDGRHGSISASIGPTVNYGAFVEFGTSRQAPAAYMGPALDRVSPGFTAAMQHLAGEVLD